MLPSLQMIKQSTSQVIRRQRLGASELARKRKQGGNPSKRFMIQVSNDGQFGRLSFFKNAAKRGSPCRFFSSGSKFVKVTLPSR